MNPSTIPFNVFIAGLTNSAKSRFVVDQIYGPFRCNFDYIVLICPTFAHNKTYHRIGENDPLMFVIICVQYEEENWLKPMSFLVEGTNTLIILDDCAASKDVKWRTGQLVNLAFSGPHIGISVLGADPEDDQHNSFLPGERGGDRSLLHPRSQDHESHL